MTLSSLRQEIEAVSDKSGEDDYEILAAQVFEVAVERKELLRNKYPFDVSFSRIGVKEDWTEGLVYLFCLAMSNVDSSQIGHRERDFTFERLAKTAAERYFGGEGVQTGAKWKEHGHNTFAELLTKVGSLLTELGLPKITQQPGGGDGGWDVIIVKNFGDGLYPRLVICGNCATGKTDWEQKGSETEAEHWFHHFFGAPPRGPLFEFYAFPFALTDDQRSRKTGPTRVLFDRFRLAEYGLAEHSMNEWLLEKAQPATEQLTFI